MGNEIISRERASALGLRFYFTGLECRNGHVAERYTTGWSCVECERIKGRAKVLSRNPNARRYGEKTEEQKRAQRRATRLKAYYRNRDRILERQRAKRKERTAIRPPKPPKPPIDVEDRRAKGRAKQTALRRKRGDLTMAAYHAKLRAAKEARATKLASERAVRVEERRIAHLALEPERLAKRKAAALRQRESNKAWRSANPDRMRKLIRAWKHRNPEKVKAARRKRGSKTASRRAWLMKVQRGRCAICRGRMGKETHIDHVIPLKLGGPDRRSNLQLTCPTCNLSKGAQHPLDHARSLGRLL